MALLQGLKAPVSSSSSDQSARWHRAQVFSLLFFSIIASAVLRGNFQFSRHAGRLGFPLTCTVFAMADDVSASSKESETSRKIFRKDYTPAPFFIDFVDLDFELHDEETIVTSVLTMRRRAGVEPEDLELDGEGLELKKVAVAGTVQGVDELVDLTNDEGDGHAAQYYVQPSGNLVIRKHLLPTDADVHFVLKTQVAINPKGNLALSGLYKTEDLFVTQNEAHGFRRITYFLDRPDVLSTYRVRINAPSELRVLLSNGNKTLGGPALPGRHFAEYQDPYPKPCYLFALVAGDLTSISENFTTMSGREVKVSLYSSPKESSKLSWALKSVLRAMKWDEERFGREYQYDEFRVVCVHAFNAGAMENTSLNIFNCNLLLTDPKTSSGNSFLLFVLQILASWFRHFTGAKRELANLRQHSKAVVTMMKGFDNSVQKNEASQVALYPYADYQRVLNVIGHEYFHHWSGNRVTCRDWFQLTLKEGLTVFRDQLFTEDMTSRAVKRVEDVRDVVENQFPEDDGPFAHPIRPESYVAVDNLYTPTVYEKGAEVIRMYHTLLGEEGFRKGMDLYFERHDGQAVTCDDFRAAMADANNRNLTQFEHWYLQAGTPRVDVVEAFYNMEEKAYTLTLKQHTPPTPGQPTKKPFHIPVKVGCIGRLSKRDVLNPPTQVLELTKAEQTFELKDVGEPCVLSLFRDFSAPIKLSFPQQTDEDIAFLMGYDTDDVSRWSASQRLASGFLVQRAEEARKGEMFTPLTEGFLDAFKAILQRSPTADPHIRALVLELPSVDVIRHDVEGPVDPEAILKAHRSVKVDVYRALKEDFETLYDGLTVSSEVEERADDERQWGRRALRNAVLTYLTSELDKKAAQVALTQFETAQVMTDKVAALRVLTEIEGEEKERALRQFYEEAKGNDLLLNKWFALQAVSSSPGTTSRVAELSRHPDFKPYVPNSVRSLFGAYSVRSVQFHAQDGSGYNLLADFILSIDRHNPSTAAGLAESFADLEKFEETRKEKMRAVLKKLLDEPELSDNVRELVEKILAQN
ncbi:aminopeptidase n [Cystoisospora suis]|uniref:Aminopeptidase n n=1 Tax=Cystoisospora suis TaxID=483139 RepID=A0A2C6KYN4_9APIC|nr:aminopeptidase n [Cystoisospora suis]